MKLYFIGNIRKLKFTPNVGLECHDPEIKVNSLMLIHWKYYRRELEPTTLRLRVSCSTDCIEFCTLKKVNMIYGLIRTT